MYYRTRLAHDLKVDEEKIQRLTDLGLDMKGGLKGDPNIPAKKVSFNKREANWEANFLLIQQYKEEFGLSAFLELKQKSASHGMYKHLYNWVRIFLFTLFYSPGQFAAYVFAHTLVVFVW
jgi:hypothetical protein